MYTSTFTFLLIASQALTILAIPAPISPTTGLRLVLSRQAAEAGINATAEAARIEDLATKFESLRASLETAEGNPNLTAAETAARIETLKTAISNGETGKGLGAQANAAQLKDGDNLLKVKDNIGAILQAGAETDAERKAEIAAAGAAANGTASGEVIASNSTSNGTAGTEGAATVASEDTGASSKDKLIASLEDALAAAKAS